VTKPTGPASLPRNPGGWPNVVAVLGHSGTTGQNSDLARPNQDAPENSWATGTNPKVNSIFLRVRANNPQARAVALGHDGATVVDFLDQARQAVRLHPVPDLFLVQIMDNDIVCPASAGALAAFRNTLIAGLRILSQNAPHAKTFVLSQFGSPGTQLRTLSHLDRLAAGGTGICDIVDPNGRTVPRKLARLDRTIHRYEAQLKAGCMSVARCVYDGGANGRIVERKGDFSSDNSHLAVQGLAREAAVAWATMRRMRVIGPGSAG
jgi:hypothetical protein